MHLDVTGQRAMIYRTYDHAIPSTWELWCPYKAMPGQRSASGLPLRGDARWSKLKGGGRLLP